MHIVYTVIYVSAYGGQFECFDDLGVNKCSWMIPLQVFTTRCYIISVVTIYL